MEKTQLAKCTCVNKERAATEVGIHSNVIRLSEETTQEELLEYVNKLNHDASIHGILVQLPLPKHIDTDAVLEAIVPEKMWTGSIQ